VTRIKLDYIHEFIDRHGKVRRYFRRPGFKRVRLTGPPGSSEFMEAYQAALAREEPRLEIGASRTRPGTVNAAVVAFYGSNGFLKLRPITKATDRGILERFRAKHGDKRISMLERRHILAILAEKAAAPAAQRNLLRMLRKLLAFAIETGLRADNPAASIRANAPKSSGFHTWSEDEIARFEAHHAIGTRARLALALLLYTAQRRADVVRIGRQHVRNGALHLTQGKTGAELVIPVHPELATIIAATPSDQLTYLVTEYGQPFTPAGFGNWFRAQCNAAGLPRECAAHGLRKAACRRLAEAGASANVIAAISGHRTLREVERYTRAADQARMARAGMELTIVAFPATRTRTSSGKPE
jgi:integrase